MGLKRYCAMRYSTQNHYTKNVTLGKAVDGSAAITNYSHKTKPKRILLESTHIIATEDTPARIACQSHFSLRPFSPSLVTTRLRLIENSQSSASNLSLTSVHFPHSSVTC